MVDRGVTVRMFGPGAESARWLHRSRNRMCRGRILWRRPPRPERDAAPLLLPVLQLQAQPVLPHLAPPRRVLRAAQPGSHTSASSWDGRGADAGADRNLFDIPDWYPTDHPAMPDVVQHGRRPDVRACGYCHLPNGQGRPENAAYRGLARGYFLQQMADFKNGTRKSSEPRMGPPALMITIAKATTDEENKAAAEYFRSIAAKPWIRVVEGEHRAEDTDRGRHDGPGRARRHGADRHAHHRGT